MGSTGPDLLIDRLDHRVAALLKVPTAQLLSRSLVHLVSPRSVPPLLWGVAEAAERGRDVTVQLDLQRSDTTLLPVRMFLSPLHPPASSAFSFVPLEFPSHARSDCVEALRVGPQDDPASTSMRAADAGEGAVLVPLTRLTAREADIVSRLMTGDRVPAIGRDLFLSQSTVRNHLSSVFKKLHVHGQQELVELLRCSGAPVQDSGQSV
jgi:DNA-binding CsgD family transcriptional regulator